MRVVVVELGQVAAFWSVSLLFIVTPGADWAYAITAGTRYRSPLPGVTGMLGGHLVATVVVAAGVGAMIAQYPAALTVLTMLGATYLVWLGVGTLRHPPTAHISETGQVESWGKQWWKGLGVSGLNPKVFLLFLALLPQFTAPRSTWPVGMQILGLGMIHLVTCAVVYLIVAYGAQRLLRSRPVALRVVSIVSGSAMVLIGVFLIVEKSLTGVHA